MTLEQLSEQYAERLTSSEIEVLDALIDSGDEPGALAYLLRMLAQNGESVTEEELDTLAEACEELSVDGSVLDEIEVR